MEDKSIFDIIAGLRAGESIEVRYLENLKAIEISARKETYHRGPASGSAIKISAEELNIIRPDLRDIYIRNSILTTIEQVRENEKVKREQRDADLERLARRNRKDE